MKTTKLKIRIEQPVDFRAVYEGLSRIESGCRQIKAVIKKKMKKRPKS